MHKHFKIKKKQVHDLLFPWLTIAVTDSITGVKYYKWDSRCKDWSNLSDHDNKDNL
jgi:hypothetical protein